MMLTHPQIDFLKQLAARPSGEIPLAPSHHPERWKDLEQAGYITANPPTRGDLSVLIFKITDAGRQVLVERQAD
jgi:hypothetical protein